MATENLTTYTEVDAGGDLTVTSTRVTHTTMGANVVNYLYDSKGAAHWSGDFVIDFEHYHSQANGGFSSAFLASISDTLGDLYTVGTCLGTYVEGTGFTPYVMDIDSAGNWDAFSSASNLTADTLFYSTMTRDGNTLYWDIYNDSARTDLFDFANITIVNTSQTFEYMFATSSINFAEANTISGYVQNIDLNEVGAGATGKSNPLYGPLGGPLSGAIG